MFEVLHIQSYINIVEGVTYIWVLVVRSARPTQAFTEPFYTILSE